MNDEPITLSEKSIQRLAEVIAAKIVIPQPTSYPVWIDPRYYRPSYQPYYPVWSGGTQA